MDNGETERKKVKMAEARAIMQARFDEAVEDRQRRLADAIHASVAEAGDPVSVEEARRQLAEFGQADE